MKLLSKTAAVLGFALAIAGTASAQTVIHISGATTYRACVHQAISEILDSGFTFACDNANPYKQGAAIYSGKLNQGNPSTDPSVIIKTYWTGSAAGVYDLCHRNVITGHYPANGTTLATSTGFDANGNTTFSGAFVLAGGYTKEDAAPDAVLTDAFQNSVAASLSTATLGGGAASDSITGASLIAAGTSGKAADAGVVGLIAFQWVIGRTSGTQPSVTNITQTQASAIISGGSMPVAFLSGLSADLSKYLLLVGRNEDSGTRIDTHAEAQNGFGNSVLQFALTFSGSVSNQSDGRATGGATSTVTAFDLWPSNAALNTAPGINWQTSGHSGYIGGGDVKAVLQSTNPSTLGTGAGKITDSSGFLPGSTSPIPATNAFFIGYLGTSDASVGGNAIQLSYNGVPFSVANVDNGSYSLWAYEHMYYLGSGTGAISGTTQAIADAIADKLFTTDADVNNNAGAGGINVHGTSGSVLQAGIFFNSSLKVSRQVEGGVITQNF